MEKPKVPCDPNKCILYAKCNASIETDAYDMFFKLINHQTITSVTSNNKLIDEIAFISTSMGFLNSAYIAMLFTLSKCKSGHTLCELVQDYIKDICEYLSDDEEFAPYRKMDHVEFKKFVSQYLLNEFREAFPSFVNRVHYLKEDFIRQGRLKDDETTINTPLNTMPSK